MVKFIDAKKDLSVQVHPSDEYAREYEGDNGKTEMWHIIYGYERCAGCKPETLNGEALSGLLP